MLISCEFDPSTLKQDTIKSDIRDALNELDYDAQNTHISVEETSLINNEENTDLAILALKVNVV